MTLLIYVEISPFMILLRKGIINIQTFHLFAPHSHKYIHLNLNTSNATVFTPCSRALQKWVRKEHQVSIIHFIQVAEGGGGVKRKQEDIDKSWLHKQRERAVNSEVIHEI